MIQPSACDNFRTSSRAVKTLGDPRRAAARNPAGYNTSGPAGAFTPALNALAAHASKQGCGLALFASVETFSSETVAALREQLCDARRFVVGAALPGHDFRDPPPPLGGRTAPWNTRAGLASDRLCLVGFPLVADEERAHAASTRSVGFSRSAACSMACTSLLLAARWSPRT